MDVEKLLAVCEAATSGPWHELEEYGRTGVVCGAGISVLEHCKSANAAFIAAAREHFPELLRRWKRVSELVGFYVREYPDWQCHSIEIPHRHRAELRELLDLPAEGK